MTMRVSTLFRSCEIPSSALVMRRVPSKRNGLVTTAIVKIPSSFLAISAIIGAAPVQVPPPIPPVIKTISVPAKTSLILSFDSSAAF